MNPQRFFTQTASLEVRTGGNPYQGDTYADPVSMQVRVSGENDLIRTSDGVETVAALKLATLTPLSLQDRVTVNGITFKVVKVMQSRDTRGTTTHYVGWLQ